jgi:hypothetical protein
VSVLLSHIHFFNNLHNGHSPTPIRPFRHSPQCTQLDIQSLQSLFSITVSRSRAALRRSRFALLRLPLPPAPPVLGRPCAPSRRRICEQDVLPSAFCCESSNPIGGRGRHGETECTRPHRDDRFGAFLPGDVPEADLGMMPSATVWQSWRKTRRCEAKTCQPSGNACTSEPTPDSPFRTT